jgi:hypothetical protein
MSNAEPGLFARHGIVPDIRSVSKVSRTEATRAVLEYLAQNVLPEHFNWEHLSEKSREAWVTATSDVYQKAVREAATAAMAEVRAREALALELHCRKCAAAEGTACWDMRTRLRKHISHPHQERMDDIEEEAAAL